MTKKVITWKEFRDLVKRLEQKIIKSGKWKNIKNVYGIPRGGQYVALMFSEMSNIPMTNEITEGTLIVDDVVDSGSTLVQYHGKGVALATLHYKPYSSIKPHFYVEETRDWVVYPWECTKDGSLQDNILRILEFLGVNSQFFHTPKKVDKLTKQVVEFVTRYVNNEKNR